MELAMQAIDEIGKAFQIDGVDDMKLETIEALVKRVCTSAENTALMQQLSPLLDEFLANDTFEAAKRLGGIAVAVARKTRDAATTRQAIARSKEIEEAAEAYVTDDRGVGARTVHRVAPGCRRPLTPIFT